jgi:hypothetical protein
MKAQKQEREEPKVIGAEYLRLGSALFERKPRLVHKLDLSSPQ